MTSCEPNCFLVVQYADCATLRIAVESLRTMTQQSSFHVAGNHAHSVMLLI